MRLGLVSDTHDNLPLAEVAARLFEGEGVDQVFHLGDVMDPETLAPFEGFPLVVLRGNNDDEPWPSTWRQDLGGLRVGATHGHEAPLLRSLVQECDLVLHGHTHRRRAERVERALVVNPGALHRTPRRTVAIIELPSLALTFYEVREDGAFPMRTS